MIKMKILKFLIKFITINYNKILARQVLKGIGLGWLSA